MKLLRIALLVAVIAAAFFAGRRFASSGAPASSAPGSNGRKVLYWVDPMHPAYKSDKPGIAPDCGMRLEPVYANEPAGAASTPAAQKKVVLYRDPKDPKYTSDKPGLNPATGNELEPVYEGDRSAMPPGTVEISAERQQLIGVRYGTAEYSPGTETIRVVGKVAIDETRQVHVHSRTEGFVEEVLVGATGEFVKKGQPLLTLYSPELLASQQEYLLAIRARDVMRQSPLHGVAEDMGSLVEASRRRLELWDLSEPQIEQVERTGKPITAVTVYAPASGYVTTRNAFPNQKVMPETDLYALVDLSRVWVQAAVFEYQAAAARVGQPAVVSLPYSGGKTYRARVSFIQPQVDPATRTLQVRLELPNPGTALKPDMFVNVELSSPEPPRLTVPASAVLDTGMRKVVFVDRGNGFFEPRDIATGVRTGDRIQVLSGLKAGERIVISGNFLINSESQLKSAAEGAGGMPDMPGMAPAAKAAAAATTPGAPPSMPDMPNMKPAGNPAPREHRHD